MKTKIVLIILMSAFSFVAIGKQQSDIKNPEKYSINNQKYKSLYLDKFLKFKKRKKTSYFRGLDGRNSKFSSI